MKISGFFPKRTGRIYAATLAIILFSMLILLLLLSGCGKSDSGNNSDSSHLPGSTSSENNDTGSDGSSGNSGSNNSDTSNGTGDEGSQQESASVKLAKELLAKMTLEEKVGQLIMIRPENIALYESSEGSDAAFPQGTQSSNTRTVFSDGMADGIKKYPIGGVVLFGPNIETPQQVRSYISAFQEASSIPLFVGVDEEGGRVSRIAGADGFDIERLPTPQGIGEQDDWAMAYDMYEYIGTYLSDFGFNLDLAPVADINSNPDNIVIGSRSFGSSPELVSTMVSSAIDGLHSKNILACIKHFPGHGDTVGDTHDGYVSLDKTWSEMLSCEIIPFASSLNKTDMVMAAHITLPNVSSDGLPASLSKEILTGKLREEMGYKGVIITDSMTMGAITENYTSGQCAVLAISAGADIILDPADHTAAFSGIIDAIENGTISEARIDESVLRILELKYRYGIIK